MFKTFRGFTLIELLVVIAIIGILSSIVLASLNSARLKSRDARRVADLKQLQLALQLFYDAHSSYPTTTDMAGLTPTYIPTIPTDPVGQTAYLYDPLPSAGGSSASSYHLAANLEDPTNQALQSDLDSVSTNINGADSADCAGGASGRRCYDVSP